MSTKERQPRRIGYLLCTEQGLPLLTKHFYQASSSSSSSSSPPSGPVGVSRSHWKTISQYICLSAGFWTKKTCPFTFTLNSTEYYVTPIAWQGKTLFSCLEQSAGTGSDHERYPLLLSFYLGWKFIGHCVEIDKDSLTRLLQDIHQHSEQISREGTFSESIGNNQDEMWEEFLHEHELHDRLLSFEEEVLNTTIQTHHSDYMRIFPNTTTAISGQLVVYYIAQENDTLTLLPLAASMMNYAQTSSLPVDLEHSNPWKSIIEQYIRSKKPVEHVESRFSFSIWSHDEILHLCHVYISLENSLVLAFIDYHDANESHDRIEAYKSKLFDEDQSLFFSHFVAKNISEYMDEIDRNVNKYYRMIK